MAANVTRTVYTCNAYGLIVAFDADNKPTVTESEKVEFTSTKPNETEAVRALRNAGMRFDKNFVRFEIVSEKVYAMTLDDFIAHATVVERGVGGYVRKFKATEPETED